VPDPVLLNSVVDGDVLAVLAGLPAAWFHVIITSPPYWGLRSYLDLVASIWGGDPACEHVWGEAQARPGSEYRGGLGANSTFAGRADKAAIRKQLVRHGLDGSTLEGGKSSWGEQGYTVTGGAFCQRCGAWRGHFGLEPLHDCLAWARGEDPCAACYVCHTRTVLRALWRVLRADGLVFWNLGDSYAGTGSGKGTGNFAEKDNPEAWTPAGKSCGGIKATELVGIPERVKLAAQADGWYLRSDIVWHKPSCMPESTGKRPTRDHEYIVMLSKSPSSAHWFDAEAVRERDSGQRGSAMDFRRATKDIAGPGQSTTQHREGRPSTAGTGGRNIRTVWKLKPEPSNYDFCDGCGTLFIGSDRKGIREFCAACGAEWPRSKRKAEACPACGDDEKGRERECPTCKARDGWVAHYAAFPSSLPRRCILAGTSEAGCCAECGMPWERVVDVSHEFYGRQKTTAHASVAGSLTQGWEGARCARKQTRTLGWLPACSCGLEFGGPQPLAVARAQTVPCRVLDPFSGTGTTPLVAAQLGRDWLGIDGSPSYARMSRERIRVLGTRRAAQPPAAAMPLFATKGASGE